MREIFERFTENCASKYTPEALLRIDEQLLPLKIRCDWTTFMPNKPDKFWVLVENESKYVFAIQPYLGKDETANPTGKLSTRAVLSLLNSAGLLS